MSLMNFIFFLFKSLNITGFGINNYNFKKVPKVSELTIRIKCLLNFWYQCNLQSNVPSIPDSFVHLTYVVLIQGEHSIYKNIIIKLIQKMFGKFS